MSIQDTRLGMPLGAPEQLFGLLPAQWVDGGASQSLRTGDWTRGPDGKPSGAALGVLIDDGLGAEILPSRPAGMWPVSTEISVDFVTEPPADGMVHATARLVARRGMTALASGTVSDDAGNPLAVASCRSRFLPGEPDLTAYNQITVTPEHDSLFALLDASASLGGDSATLTVPPNPALTNPIGALHGGVTLCAAHLAGTLALSPDGNLSIASIRIAYLRPISVAAPMEFVATAVHRGRRFGIAEVVIHDAAGKPCAVATVAGNSID